MLKKNLERNRKGGGAPFSLIVLACFYAFLVFTNPTKQEFRQFIINGVEFPDDFQNSLFGELAKSVVGYGVDSILSCSNYYAFTTCQIEKNWITSSLGVDLKLIGIGGQIFNLTSSNPKSRKHFTQRDRSNVIDIQNENNGFREAIERELINEDNDDE